MRKILLIGAQLPGQDLNDYYGRYQEFFEKSVAKTSIEAQVSYCFMHDLTVVIGANEFVVRDTKNQEELKNYDLVLIRGHHLPYMDLARAVSVYLKEYNIPIVNDYADFRSASKLHQAVYFYQMKVPSPRTIYASNQLLLKPDVVPVEYPCVVKATNGSHGNHNFLVKDYQQLCQIVREHPDQPFVIQEVIKNDCDYRVLIVGDESIIIRRSASDGSHLNNTSQGGRAELVEPTALPAIALEQAKRLAAEQGQTISGVDVLYDPATQKHYFLETNSQPQIMSGASMPEKEQLFADYFTKLFGSSPE